MQTWIPPKTLAAKERVECTHGAHGVVQSKQYGLGLRSSFATKHNAHEMQATQDSKPRVGRKLLFQFHAGIGRCFSFLLTRQLCSPELASAPSDSFLANGLIIPTVQWPLFITCANGGES